MSSKYPPRRINQWTQEQIDYVIAFQTRLRRGLARHAGQDLDDVVHHEVLQLLDHIVEKMAAYPSPIALAAGRSSGGRAHVDYLRRQRQAQAATTPAGKWDEGLKSNRTHWHRHDQPVPEVGHTFDDTTIDNQMLRQALLRLPLDQREVLMLVDLQGYSVNEAAQLRGEQRETTSRKRHQAYRTLRGLGDDLQPPC